MMTPRNASARLVLGSALLSAVSLVAAQVDPASPVLVPGQRVILMQRAAEPAPGQDGNTVAAGKSDAEDLDEVPTTNSIGSFDETQREQLIKQHDQKRQQLRQQLADPAQRAQLRAERIRQLRAERPDLARVVGMDAKTEERLMELLAERAFASELAPSPFERNSSSLGFNQGAPGNSSRSPDAEYTRQMSEVAKLLGAVQLERYLDYQQSLWQRSQVEQFDAALPVKDKLNADQKDRMVALLEEQQQSSGQELQIRGWFGLRTFGDPTQSMQERDRRMAEHNILINERAAADMEIANRNLLERLTAVLTPEQSAVFAKLQQERVTTLRRWTQQERRRRGISPDQVLERPEDAAPTLDRG